MNLAEERAFIEEVDLWVAAAWAAGRFRLPPSEIEIVSGPKPGWVTMNRISGFKEKA